MYAYLKYLMQITNSVKKIGSVAWQRMFNLQRLPGWFEEVLDIHEYLRQFSGFLEEAVIFCSVIFK